MILSRPVPMENLWRYISCMVFILIHGVYFASATLDPMEPDGNITVKWDILSWTDDGYNALVTISNYQQYRHIEYPGWSLGWSWRGKEVIWDMLGGEATEQGDCSAFKENSIPHSCKRHPIIVDLLATVSNNVKIENCCRGDVLSSTVQNPQNSVAAFKI
ncbi:hypothetical protein SUGI_0695600 [Cryptomeria japonica]|nr:hypothetical protein SUGI_0695600 [Cryptomeria japonica]